MLEAKPDSKPLHGGTWQQGQPCWLVWVIGGNRINLPLFCVKLWLLEVRFLRLQKSWWIARCVCLCIWIPWVLADVTYACRHMEWVPASVTTRNISWKNVSPLSNKINDLILQAEIIMKRCSSRYQTEVNINSHWESAYAYVYVTRCRGESLHTSDMHAMCKKTVNHSEHVRMERYPFTLSDRWIHLCGCHGMRKLIPVLLAFTSIVRDLVQH